MWTPVRRSTELGICTSRCAVSVTAATTPTTTTTSSDTGVTIAAITRITTSVTTASHCQRAPSRSATASALTSRAAPTASHQNFGCGGTPSVCSPRDAALTRSRPSGTRTTAPGESHHPQAARSAPSTTRPIRVATAETPRTARPRVPFQLADRQPATRIPKAM